MTSVVILAHQRKLGRMARSLWVCLVLLKSFKPLPIFLTISCSFFIRMNLDLYYSLALICDDKKMVTYYIAGFFRDRLLSHLLCRARTQLMLTSTGKTFLFHLLLQGVCTDWLTCIVALNWRGVPSKTHNHHHILWSTNPRGSEGLLH